MSVRIERQTKRFPRLDRGDPFEIEVDGQRLDAFQGETIAAVLLANGIRRFQGGSEELDRGLVCGIGRCFSCRVAVNGQKDVRACITPARPGMSVRTDNQGETS